MSTASYLGLLRLILPEVVVALAAFVVLTADIVGMRRASAPARWRVGALLASAGCVGAIALLHFQAPSASLFDGMLVVTPLTQLIEMALDAFAILTVLLSVRSTFTTHVGEYLGLILFATTAAMFLVSTQNLLLIFIALEMLSLSLYILTGFQKQSSQSAEAALKYFLFGGMSAGFFLFGVSLLYGLSGSINLAQIASALQGQAFSPLLAVALVMIVIGFGFKVAAVPFHLWAPDAYQGAPTPSAALIASSSKIASFFIFSQVMLVGLATAAGSGAWNHPISGWVPVLCVVAALSMILGNLAAIVQTSVRRLLAYSAIGHAGYMLLGIAAHTERGLSALIYYVLTYALATIGAFGVLAALEEEGADRLTDFAGLSRRAPLLSFCMLIFLLSLAGIPPLAGFFGKFYLFSSALATSDGYSSMLWLVILALAMSAVSLYYYLKVLKQIYVVEGDPERSSPIHTPLTVRATLCLIALLVILLGCLPDILLNWIGNAWHLMSH